MDFVHPVVLSMVTSKGKDRANTNIEKLKAKSKHYLERMGLFKILD